MTFPQHLRVVTPVVNNPAFIRLQHAGLKAFLNTPHEFVIFNDAKDFPDATNYGDTTMRQQIEETCRELLIRCVPVPNGHHRHTGSASHRHADTLRYIMRVAKEEGWGPILMLDSDMFPVAPLRIPAYHAAPMGAFVIQTRGHIRYLWPNLFYLDFSRNPLMRYDALSWDVTPGCDSGGASQTWLTQQEHEGRQPYWIRHLPSCTWGPTDLPPHLRGLLPFFEGDVRNQGSKFWAELYDGVFLHYRAGSNWNGEGPQVHQAMTALLATTYRAFLANPQNPS